MPIFGVDVTEKLFGVKDLSKAMKSGTMASGGVKAATSSRSDGSVAGASTSRAVPTVNQGAVYGPFQVNTPAYKAPSGGTDTGGDIERNAGNQKKAAEEARKAMMEQINSDYNNWINELSQQEGALNTQLPLTVGTIEQGANALTSDIQGQQAQQEADLGNQATTAQTGTQGLMTQARQTYNELLSGANKFGGSAQGAYGELLGRGTAQTMGTAQQNLQNTLAQIAGEKTRLVNYYNSKLNDVAQKKNLAIQQAQTDLRNEIAKINNQRNEAQSWKANQNASALANFKQRVADIQDAASTAKRSLDMWNAEQSRIAADKTKAAQFSIPQATEIAGVKTSSGVPIVSDFQNLYGNVGKDINSIDWSNIFGTVSKDKNSDSFID